MERKLLCAKDMAKVYSERCNGCGDCCRGMGDTIHLDPYDIFLLTKGLGKSFDEMMGSEVALHREDGLVLPHLRMRDGLQGEETGDCLFLDDAGHCTIHAFRPGFCRLFPLGREYDADTQSFGYFVVEEGCTMPGKLKVKINKWLSYENLASYEAFVARWHFFVRAVKERAAAGEDPAFLQQLNLFVLKVFYQTPYDPERDFYEQFAVRMRNAESVLC